MKISDAKVLVIDLETTGVDHTVDEVVEFGAVHVDFMNHLSFVKLCKPDKLIPAAASAIHHITDEMLVIALPFNFNGYCAKITESIGAFNILCGHNIIGFDNKFLPDHDFMLLDTMLIAKKVWYHLESYSNQFIRYHFKLYLHDKVGRAAHDARADAMITAYIWKRLLVDIKKSGKIDFDDEQGIEKLIAWANEPNLLKICKFPKHRGKDWADVPHDYLQWILRDVKDADADLVFTCNHYLGTNTKKRTS